MNSNKMNSDSNSKGKFYPKKTSSDKSIRSKEKDISLQLSQWIESEKINYLNTFLKKESPNPQILNEALNSLFKHYNKENSNFYKILNLLLSYGASPNISIIYNDEKCSIKKEEKINLLMFGIIQNDITLINLILNFDIDIEQKDSFERTAIIYAILYDNNDSTTILNLLIKKNANINYSLNLNKNFVQSHSVLSLACLKNLLKIVKCLLENNADTNFRIQPEGDTCLHIAVKYGYLALVRLLLSCPRINPDITNNEGKKAVELIKQDENEEQMKSFFNNCYNKDLRDNIQNPLQIGNYKGSNLNINNMNMENYSAINNNDNNNIISQMNQTNKLNKINLRMNDEKRNFMNNFPNVRFNYVPSGINLMTNKENKNIEEIIRAENHENQIKYKKFINNNEVLENKSFKKISNSENRRQQISNYIIVDKSNEDINQINQNIKNLLYNNLQNKLVKNTEINYNMEIPVEFLSTKNQIKNNLFNIKNFFIQNNIPILNLNLTNNHILQKELKIIELKEKLEKLKESKRNCLEKIKKNQVKYNEEIQGITKIEKEKNIEKNYLHSLIEENKIKIGSLKNKNDELLEKICKNHYKQLKFEPPFLGQNFLYKTLEKDLFDYEKYITYLIESKKPKIEEIINKLKMIVNEINPDYNLKIYGSYGYGLFFPWSDINLILVNKNNNFNNNNKEENILNIADIETGIDEKSISNENKNQNENDSMTQKFVSNDNNKKEEESLFSRLNYIFENCKWIIKVETKKIYNINIIHFITDKNSGEIEINISIQNESHNGLKVVELIKSYIEEYSTLRPLTLALGTIMKMAHLNKQFPGGLPLYGLILMIVSYIQNKKDNNDCEENECSIGKTFYDLISYYGQTFDFNKYVILTYEINDTNDLNEKEPKHNISQNVQELIIVDPLDKNNNVAKLTYQFVNIKMALMIASMATKENCECGCHYGKASNINNICSIERSHLKRIFNSVKRF